MPSSFTCPYCNHTMPVTRLTLNTNFCYFDETKSTITSKPNEDLVYLRIYRCAKCEKYLVTAQGIGEKVSFEETPLLPKSNAIQFPDYIPSVIRQDYEEACAIVNLSPKASATLSRRCIQAMIRDYWGIKKSRLVDEIDDLEGKVQPSEQKVLHALRNLGNIGAHPEKDVNTIIDINPDEAEKMIKIIELFMHDWYIQRHEREELFNEITEIEASKK